MSLAAAALALVRVLPASAAVLLSRSVLLGYLAFRPDYRAEIRRNYRAVFGAERPGFWVANAWCVGRNLALMSHIGRGSEDKIVDTAAIRPDNIADEILERKLHVTMSSFHFGLWEYLPQVFASRAVPVRLVTGRQREPALEKQLVAIRTSHGASVVQSTRGLVRTLPAPGISGFMLYNTSQGSQQWVRVDRVCLRVPSLPFRLAQRRGAAVTAMFARLENGRLRVEACEPGDARAAARALLEQVRRHPEEWVFWGKAGAVRTAEAA